MKIYRHILRDCSARMRLIIISIFVLLNIIGFESISWGKTASTRLFLKSEEIEYRRRQEEQRATQLLSMLENDDGYKLIDFDKSDILSQLYIFVLARPDLFETVLTFHSDNMDESFYSCLQERQSSLAEAIQILESQINLPTQLGAGGKIETNPLAYPLAQRQLREYRQGLLFVRSLLEARGRPSNWPSTPYGQIRVQREELEEQLSEYAEQLPRTTVSLSVGALLVQTWPDWSPMFACPKN